MKIQDNQKNSQKNISAISKKENLTAWWQPSLVLFSRLSGWIIGPVLVAVLFGHWLDGKYQTEPWGLLVCVGLAFVGSSIGIVKEATKAMKEMEKK